MSGLGRVIRQSRQQASLSLHALAVASGVSHSEIHKLENGESAAPKITTLTKLSGALGVPLQVLLEASGTDVRQPAGELREAGTLLDPEALRLRLRAGADSGAPGSSDAGVSLVLPTKRLTKRQQAHYEEQLALICRMAFDARGWLMPVVRGYSRELNGRFSDQTLSHDAHAATYLGRSQLIYGMTFVEELPPPPSARAMLRRAQRNARASEDWSTYYQALWREAEQFRKAGDHYVSNDPRRTLKLYHQALQRLKLILRDDHRAPLAALKSAHAEWAKVLLGRDGPGAPGFTDAIARAFDPLPGAPAKESHGQPGGGRTASWPPLWDEHAEVYIRDTKLRGLAACGGPDTELERLAAEARGFRSGLTPVYDQVVLPYELAQSGLLSSNADDWGHAVLTVLSSIEAAKSGPWTKQVRRGERLLQARATRARAPRRFDARCPRCKRTATFGSNFEGEYQCGNCRYIIYLQGRSQYVD